MSGNSNNPKLSSSQDRISIGLERRIAPRQSLVRFVWYKVIGETANPEADKSPESWEGISKMCDISATGAGIEISRPIPRGTRIFMEISSINATISCVGEVVHIRTTDTGLHRLGARFIAIPPHDRLVLATLLEDDEHYRT